jgi:hypothetical protein
MSQLLIIDVQNTYRQFINKSLYKNIEDFSKPFGKIIYLWDNLSGQDLFDEIPDEWRYNESEDYDEDNNFSNQFYTMEKQYGFFRGLMDYGIEDENIVKLAKFMIENNLTDAREISENEDTVEKFNQIFKNTELEGFDFDSYSFGIPDVLDSLRSQIRDGVVVVGGGVNECLKEVTLLLDILNIKYTVNYSLTY